MSWIRYRDSVKAEVLWKALKLKMKEHGEYYLEEGTLVKGSFEPYEVVF